MPRWVAARARSGATRQDELSRTSLVDHERFENRDRARLVIGDYLENFYNTTRRHSRIGCVSPIEFELKEKLKQIAA
jgi:transposase InsO family protein